MRRPSVVRCQAEEGGIERTCQEPGQCLSQLPQLTVFLDDGANDASRGTDMRCEL